MLGAFTSMAHTAQPQAITNTLWAVATIGQQIQPEMLQQLLGAFASLAHAAKPQEISNILWAVATMGQQVQDGMLQQLLAAFLSMAHTAKPQHISNTLWAVATMQQQIQDGMLQQLLGVFTSVAQTAKPQAISNIIWAVATMGKNIQPNLLQQLLYAFGSIAIEATPQVVANLLWAVSAMQKSIDHEQLQQLLRVFVSKLKQATSQAVSNTLLACARFGYLPETLLGAPGLASKLLAGTPQALANAAWACSELGYRDEHLMAAMLQQAMRQAGKSSIASCSSCGLKVQSICNLCWAVAVLDLQQQAAVVPLLIRACQQQWNVVVLEGLHQLHQVHLWLLDHQQAGGRGLLGALAEQQLQQCKAASDALLASTAKANVGDFQQSVFTALQQLSSSGRLEFLELPQMEQVSLGKDGQPNGAALIDITARTADGVMLAIEADGPWHFRQPDGALRGATLYRNRALAVRGYVVVSIPYHNWPWNNKQAQQDYLLQQIIAAVSCEPLQQQHQPHQQQQQQQQHRAAGKPATLMGGRKSAGARQPNASSAATVAALVDAHSSGMHGKAHKAGPNVLDPSTEPQRNSNSSSRVRLVRRQS